MSKYYSSSIAFGAKQTKTEKVVVSPTKIGDVTTDAVSGALTVDEVPTLDSLNPVSSDGVARAVIQAGAELPTRSSEDTGKVLTVKNSAGDLEWDEPSGGLPDMAGQDGKILGAVDNGGTMEAQWISKPVSNVTTSDKKFVVGVNGTGAPITVDCIGGTPTTEPGTLTDNGEFKLGGSYDYACVIFDLQLPNNNLGDGTATLTIPEDIDFSDTGYGTSAASACYWDNSGNNFNTFGNITGLVDTANKVIKAGTYTISGRNFRPSDYPDGIGFMIPGGGSTEAAAAFQALVQAAAPSMTMSRAAQIVTGYKVTPEAYKITDSTVSKDIYALCEAGVDKFAYVDGDGNVLPLTKKLKDGSYWLLSFTGWVQGFSNANGNNMKYCSIYTMSDSTSTVSSIKSTSSFTLAPSCTSGDNGKVLSVSSGGVAFWANPTTELPTVTGNAGKVLAVNSGATGVEWINNVPIEVVASLPADPTAGVLYIVTGA